ncbi:hypothetical protein LTR86_007610 [Recurvomyces mirabilis]|nr:hypothetical protein LTR86_007610 [Recurvomyces mirabilis]
MEPQTAVQTLDTHTTLTILDLTHPLLHPNPTTKPHTRTSAASDTSNQAPTTPTLLAADLAHYRDLFTKLRFSYVEQVTKERFLRSLVSNPPEFSSSEENAALEEKLRGDKAALKERKTEVSGLIGELEEQGRSLVGRWEGIRERRVELEALPTEIEQLEEQIQDLQAKQEPQSSNPELALPLQPTLDLLQQREVELEAIDAQIAALRRDLPVKRQEVEGLRDDLPALQARKVQAVAEAQEARRRRQEGASAIEGDEMEERGRWLRGVEAGLRGMLEV